MLKEWERNRQSTTQSTSPHTTTKLDKILDFTKYIKLTRSIKDQHAHWQIDTIEKLLNRDETLENIAKMVQIQRPKICLTCNKQKHPQWN